MQQETDGRSICGGESPKGIMLSFSFEELENLPNSTVRKKYQFTEQQDEALLKYWPVKNHKEVARVLGMCANTARERYNELTRRGNGT